MNPAATINDQLLTHYRNFCEIPVCAAPNTDGSAEQSSAPTLVLQKMGREMVASHISNDNTRLAERKAVDFIAENVSVFALNEKMYCENDTNLEVLIDLCNHQQIFFSRQYCELSKRVIPVASAIQSKSIRKETAMALVAVEFRKITSEVLQHKPNHKLKLNPIIISTKESVKALKNQPYLLMANNFVSRKNSIHNVVEDETNSRANEGIVRGCVRYVRRYVRRCSLQIKMYTRHIQLNELTTINPVEIEEGSLAHKAAKTVLNYVEYDNLSSLVTIQNPLPRRLVASLSVIGKK